MKWYLVTILLSVTLAHDHDVKVGILEQHTANEEHELISIDLKKKDGSEDIKLMVQLRIHLIKGQAHLNGNRLKHGVVNAVHMNVLLVETVKGVKKPPRSVLVHVRVLVLEDIAANGNKKLLIEEEFVKVEDYEVLQVKVTQVVYESSVRKSVTTVKLQESKIHHFDRKNDHHLHYDGPKLPSEGYKGDEDDDELYEDEDKHHKHGHHHEHGHHRRHRHHHHHKSVKCWYKGLSTKSKIALFGVSTLALITLCIFCAICYKRHQNRRQTLEIPAPIDDSIDMEKKPEGKSDADKHEFHFQMDDVVVIDDKKQLIE